MLYARHDYREEDNSMISVRDEDARGYNEKGYGIFRTVNLFEGRRLIDNLKEVLAWFVELDGDKAELKLKIKNSPIFPSRVVESKNGFHVYFTAIDGTLNNYAEIELGLVHYYGGDPRAKDAARVLREPGYYHWKDPQYPYLVREIFKCDCRYREKDMLYFFPKPKESEVKIALPLAPEDGDKWKNSSSLSAFLDQLDNKDALERLSGTSWVGGEVYTFKRKSRGRENILVNGKETSCFIDEKKRIGASHGPTAWTWLRYFGHNDKQIYDILKEIYSGEI